MAGLHLMDGYHVSGSPVNHLVGSGGGSALPPLGSWGLSGLWLLRTEPAASAEEKHFL